MTCQYKILYTINTSQQFMSITLTLIIIQIKYFLISNNCD